MANLPSAKLPKIVVTRTPLRISFAGGGTDLAEFYERDYGAVFSAAIDQFVYVTVKHHSRLNKEPIRVNYSVTELVDSVEVMKNNIARECLRLLKIDPPIYISIIGDLPTSTGLAGSSAFAVGLLNALHAYRGERVAPGQLAEEACHIEINVLKEPIGKQDQYIAAFGGLNFFRFNPGGVVSVEHARVSEGFINDLFDHILMFWTGTQRDAKSVLAEQSKNIPAKLDYLRQMREHAHQIQALASAARFDPVPFGKILHESWLLKRQLASSISSPVIDAHYEAALKAGAEGGKICGAGAGGFLLFIVRPERQNAVRHALSALLEVPIRYEAHGSRVLLPFEH